MVSGRVNRVVRLGPPGCDHAVAIGVDDAGTPPLCGLGILGLIPEIDVNPPEPAIEPVVDDVVFADLVVIGREHVSISEKTSVPGRT